MRFKAVLRSKSGDNSILKLDTELLDLKTALNLNDNNIQNVGTIFSNTINATQIQTNKISLDKEETCNVTIKDMPTSKDVVVSLGGNEKIRMNQDSTYMYNTDMWLGNNILFGDGSVRNFEYRAHKIEKTIDGYDLYVRY